MKLTKKKDRGTLVESCSVYGDLSFLRLISRKGKLGKTPGKALSINLIDEIIFKNGIIRKTNIKLGIFFSIISRLTGVRGVAGKSV